MIKEGNPAPDFKLMNDKGVAVSLKDFRGKKVVLYFYPKDSTPGCTKEACDFRDSEQRIAQLNGVVLGVSADSVESHVKFKTKHGLPFQLLSDPDKKVLKAYGVWKQKSLCGRNFMGIERTTVLIDEEGVVSKIFPKVKVDGHIDDVLGTLS